jgi:hypothetical protein
MNEPQRRAPPPPRTNFVFWGRCERAPPRVALVLFSVRVDPFLCVLLRSLLRASTKTTMDEGSLVLASGAWAVAGVVQFLMNEVSSTKGVASESPVLCANFFLVVETVWCLRAEAGSLFVLCGGNGCLLCWLQTGQGRMCRCCSLDGQHCI